jgi:flagellin
MSFSVNTNANAMAALATLSKTQASMAQTQNRISSGLKVATAADNASTFSIAQGMRSDISGLSSVSDSLSLGQSVVSIASTAAQSISDTLGKLKAAVVSAQDPTQDAATIQKSVNAYLQDITNTVNAAQFNSVNLLSHTGNGLSVISSLNRTSATAVSVANLSISQQDMSLNSGSALAGIQGLDVSAPGKSSYTFSLGNAPVITDGDSFELTVGAQHYDFDFVDKAGSSGLTSTADATHTVFQVNFDSGSDNAQSALQKAFAVMQNQGFAVSTASNGDFTITKQGLSGATYTPAGTSSIATTATAGTTDQVSLVEQAIQNTKGVLATLGAFQNQLSDQASFVKTLSDALTTGVGSLVDADMAQESANLQAEQTRQQLGIQALSIANQGPGAVLSLFR